MESLLLTVASYLFNTCSRFGKRLEEQIHAHARVKYVKGIIEVVQKLDCTVLNGISMFRIDDDPIALVEGGLIVDKLGDAGIEWNKCNGANSLRKQVAHVFDLDLNACSDLNIIRVFTGMTGFINGKGIVPFCSKPEISQYLILTRINAIYELKSDIT